MKLIMHVFMLNNISLLGGGGGDMSRLHTCRFSVHVCMHPLDLYNSYLNDLTMYVVYHLVWL